MTRRPPVSRTRVYRLAYRRAVRRQQKLLVQVRDAVRCLTK
jgi:hypothetical protein